MLKKYLISYGYLFGIILILTIILSIINYFITLPTNIIKILIPTIAIFISSIILGKNTKELAYLEGIKFSITYLLFITILNIIFKSGFNLKVFIIYILYLFISIIGSMIGINSKKNN